MHKQVDIYVSARYSELVLVKFMYTKDAECYPYEAESVPIDIKPPILGNRIKSLLASCSGLSQSWEEIEEIEDDETPVFERASKALDCEDFNAYYYGMVVWKKDKSLWVGASLSESFEEKPIQLVEPVKSVKLGETVLSLASRVPKYIEYPIEGTP